MNINVKTKQLVHQHNETSTHNNQTVGQLISKRVPYIMYTESIDDFDIDVRVKLDENGVRITRNGTIKMDFLFVEGKTTQNVYQTPAGRSVMDVITKKCIFNIEENNGTVVIEYELSEQGQSHGSFLYTLEYEERLQ